MEYGRMKKLWLPLAVVVYVWSSPVFAQQADVMAAVNRFIDGYNKSDTKLLAAACADQTSIIDEFPPHEWHGPSACLTWFKDYDIDAKKNGITDGVVVPGKPSHVDVTGDRAYVVIPSNYTYKQKGTPMKEVGSAFTFALLKGASGWRIIGWSWAKK
jgi:ketosteroid isomerase-like protein